MIILGQDKQHAALQSTYPFIAHSLQNTQLRFRHQWLPQLVFYVRPRTALPIRISCLQASGECVIIHFADTADTQLASAVLNKLPAGTQFGSCIIKDIHGLPYGLLTYDAALVLQLRPALTILFSGVWRPAADQLILDDAVLAPYAPIGIQYIGYKRSQTDTPINELCLTNNICLSTDTNCLNAFCDVVVPYGISIIGTPDAADYYINKHIMLFCSIRSDLRVINTPQHITIVGASDT